MKFWYGNSGWAWWQARLMWAGMTAFWALLVWLVYTLISGLMRQPRQPDRAGRHAGDARRIPDERLARGEIDTEQCWRLRDVLEGHQGRSPAGSRSGAGR